jgi:predicted transcriptional regulator
MTDQIDNLELATEVTIAWLGNNNTRVSADDVPAFLKQMHSALNQLSQSEDPTTAADAAVQEYTPAVSVRKSLANPEFIISLIDGKPYKALRRHLATNGLTEAEYRQRYNLKADYPMVAPAYSEVRRSMAHKIGLGRKAKNAVEAVAEPVKMVAKKAGKAAGEATKAARDHLGGSSDETSN